MLDRDKEFDQRRSRIQRLVNNKGFRLLWLLLVLVSAGFQVMTLVRLRRQGLPLFHSTLEMFLVFALITVAFVGVVFKSRHNGRN